MLEALRDIEIASRLIGDLSGQGEEEDPLDVHYRQLQCTVDPMPREHPNWGLVQDYLHKTHAPTHKVRFEGDERALFAVKVLVQKNIKAKRR